MTDHLARLPVELVFMICELVHESGQGPYLARLSKAFVPVGRRLAFGKVQVKKRVHLERLCKVVDWSSDVGAAMVGVALDMVEDDAVVGPTRVEVSSFLRRLVNVEALHIDNSPMAVGVVLEAADDQAPVLPRLVKLRIKGPPDGPTSLFDPDHYRNLHKYTRLRELELLAANVAPTSMSSTEVSAQPLLSPITLLALGGNLSGDEAAFSLLSSFASVTHLALCDFPPAGPPQDLSPLLDAVQAPALVKALVLVQGAPGPGLAADSLVRLVNLESKIGFHAWTPTLIPSFASLRHLSTVGLVACVGLSIADLDDLLFNEELLAHLTHVDLARAPGEDEGEPADEDLLPSADLFALAVGAHFIGVLMHGTLMDRVYAAGIALLEARQQEQDRAAAQEDAGARVGAAAGAAPGQTGASEMDPLRSRQLAVPAGLSPTSSRGPSLDGAASFGSNPFRDPSLNAASRDASLDLSSRDPSFDLSFASIHSGSPSVSPPLSAVSSRAQPAPSQGRPGLATRPSEVSRQLADAFKEDLPRVSEEASPSPPVSRASSTNKESKSGLWSQFRTGSGWFAPLVEADQPMTREERAAAEKERIEKLKEGRASNSSRRPGLMKRMSSGVEMGFARSRSGSQSTIRKG